jgi:hypothetical protein
MRALGSQALCLDWRLHPRLHVHTFQQAWITKEEYDEAGPSIGGIRRGRPVHRTPQMLLNGDVRHLDGNSPSAIAGECVCVCATMSSLGVRFSDRFQMQLALGLYYVADPTPPSIINPPGVTSTLLPSHTLYIRYAAATQVLLLLLLLLLRQSRRAQTESRAQPLTRRPRCDRCSSQCLPSRHTECPTRTCTLRRI